MVVLQKAVRLAHRFFDPSSLITIPNPDTLSTPTHRGLYRWLFGFPSPIANHICDAEPCAERYYQTLIYTEIEP